MSDRDELAALVRELAVVHGRVTLSSGKEADYYVDLRRATLHHRAAPLIGTLLRELVADWDFDAVGGLTMGADPVAMAVMHAPGRPIDAFVVRMTIVPAVMALVVFVAFALLFRPRPAPAAESAPSSSVRRSDRRS